MAPTSSEALAASSGNKAHVWQPFSSSPDLNHFSVASEGKLYCVQWNQNNKVIVSGGQTGVVTLNYNKDGAQMGTLPKDLPRDDDRLSAISSIAFSRGSKLLAAGCMDSCVRVWDLKQQVCKYFLESHKAAVTYVTFSTDDQVLASACLTGEIHMHSVRQTAQAAVLRTPGNRAKRSLHFTPLEPLMASGAEDGSLYVWDTTTYTLLDSYLNTHAATVSRVCFSPGSPNILISAALDKAVVLTDRRLDAIIATVQSNFPFTSLDCKDDGNCITVGNTNGGVLLYDPRKLTTPFTQLSCTGGEPVSCLHWQQSALSKSSSKKVAIPTTTPAPMPTPGPPRSALRGQEMLNAASPATPMVPISRQSQGNIHTERQIQQPPLRATSLASEQTLTDSDASYLSAAPLHDRPGGFPDNSELFGPKSGVKADPRVHHAIQNGHARQGTPEPRREYKNPLFPPLKSEADPTQPFRDSAGTNTAAATNAAGPSSREANSAAEMSHVSRKSPRQKAATTMEPTSGRLRDGPLEAVPSGDPHADGYPKANPGFEPEGGALPLEKAGNAADGGTSSYGSRLKRLVGDQRPAGVPLESPSGNGGQYEAGRRSFQETSYSRPPEASGDMVQFAQDIKAAISSDIKTLHFEMIRQFHIQQVEMKEIMEALIARQDSLVAEVSQLRSRVQQLTSRHSQGSMYQ